MTVLSPQLNRREWWIDRFPWELIHSLFILNAIKMILKIDCGVGAAENTRHLMLFLSVV